ncbi:MAG: branched-chain amino acid ABC transporter permease [Chloroflexi bacterium]|nr:branched-chain amino acid ABC transporter permease [Chloroflexota bacterium]
MAPGWLRLNLALLAAAIVNGLMLGGVYVLVSAGLTLVAGVVKIFNFSHGAILMLGMYTSYWLFTLWGIDPYLSIVFSGPLFLVVGYIVQRLSIEPVLGAPEHNQLLVTLGLLLVLENLALFLWSPDFRTLRPSYASEVIVLGDIVINRARVITAGAALVLTGLLWAMVRYTDIGRAMRAASQQREGALLVGVNVRHIYALTFGIGAAVAAIGGSLITPFFTFWPGVGNLFLLTMFVVIVLGGLGSFFGALIGGLIVGVAESLGALYMSPAIRQLVPFALFVVILLFRPSGLFGKQRG